MIEAFGLSNVYYILGLLRAKEVIIDNWNDPPKMHPSEGNFSGDQTGRVVRLADSHGGILAPSP